MFPESPRWLINRGNLEDAKVIIRKMAIRNKVEITEKQLDSLECDETATGQLWHLFTSRVLFVRTLVIFVNWWVYQLVRHLEDIRQALIIMCWLWNMFKATTQSGIAIWVCGRQVKTFDNVMHQDMHRRKPPPKCTILFKFCFVLFFILIFHKLGFFSLKFQVILK